MSVAELQAPFAPWLGRWQGEGRGLWPAEPRFRYHETVLIEAVPERPVLRFSQSATDSLTGELTHAEVGFIRLLPAQAVELILAIAGGYTEIHTGHLHDGVMTLQPHTVAISPASLALGLVRRRLELKGDQLRNTIAISVGAAEVGRHVESRLQRAVAGAA
ncbi:MAG TPA: heme-binding beta-barrel domain-containing protein [Candidatus Dormibacteraeota bacterium]|nr:heme-binding beta-barrel domain-containing protein [Candidatus Dormibacteraeota bacterium]